MKKYYFKYSLSLKVNITRDPCFVDYVIKKNEKRQKVQGLFYNPFLVSKLQIMRISFFYLKKHNFKKVYRILFNYRSSSQVRKISCAIKRVNILFNERNFFQFWCINLSYTLYLSRFVKSVGQAYYLIRSRKVYVNGKVVQNFNYLLKPGDVVFVKNLRSLMVLEKLFNTWGKFYGVQFEVPFFIEVSFSSKSFVYAGLFLE